jgi:hypothetical protein
MAHPADLRKSEGRLVARMKRKRNPGLHYPDTKPRISLSLHAGDAHPIIQQVG